MVKLPVVDSLGVGGQSSAQGQYIKQHVHLQAIAARDAFRGLCNEAAVVVADEGHQIKNPQTKRFAAVTSLKTKRRIALTGYPLQNNMDEYYTMIMWCMEDLLGDAAYFHNTFAKPIQEGEIQ